MTPREAQSEIAAVRVMLEDLCIEVGRGATCAEIRAALDVATMCLTDIEEVLDGD